MNCKFCKSKGGRTSSVADILVCGTKYYTHDAGWHKRGDWAQSPVCTELCTLREENERLKQLLVRIYNGIHKQHWEDGETQAEVMAAANDELCDLGLGDRIHPEIQEQP